MSMRMNLQQRDEPAIVCEILKRFEKDLCEKLQQSLDIFLDKIQKTIQKTAEDVVPKQLKLFYESVDGCIQDKDFVHGPVFDVYEYENFLATTEPIENLNLIFDVCDDENLISYGYSEER